MWSIQAATEALMIQEQERHVAGHRYDRDTGKQVKALGSSLFAVDLSVISDR